MNDKTNKVVEQIVMDELETKISKNEYVRTIIPMSYLRLNKKQCSRCPNSSTVQIIKKFIQANNVKIRVPMKHIAMFLDDERLDKALFN